jgi:transcriptional regulator with XRE-family HTH domain
VPNIRENIQKNIVRYRKEAKLTQAELAKKIGISSPTLSSWEQGKSIPDIDKLYELSVVLGVDLVTISGFTLSEPVPELSSFQSEAKETDAELSNPLKPDEQQLVTDYRSFNDEGKEKVREYVADLKGNPRYKKRDEPVMDQQA